MFRWYFKRNEVHPFVGFDGREIDFLDHIGCKICADGQFWTYRQTDGSYPLGYLVDAKSTR